MRITSFLGYLLSAFILQQALASPFQVERRDPAFDFSRTPDSILYPEAAPAEKMWTLCVVYPHLKDAYWLGVNYGMIKAAKRLGVEIQLFEAGGYPNLIRQREQLQHCSELADVDAIIVGTVSFAELSDMAQSISKKMPLLATVNDIENPGISAKVGVSWQEMGYSVGKYLAEKHPRGTSPVPIAWFPGPKGAGWVPFVDRGFKNAIEDSAIEVVTVGWGDTGKAVQRNLVQKALDSHTDIRYLVGNALMAEAAISVLRERNLRDDVAILSTYLTPGVYRGIARGRIVAAPTDSPVVQGMLSINQATNLLENRAYIKHMGPAIQMVDINNLQAIDMSDSLAPPNFSPVFHYKPE